MPRPGPRPYECVRRAWHSDRHQPIRGSIIQQIFRVAHQTHTSSTKKNREWQSKLPAVVLRAEEIMYSKANSEAEYSNPDTLWDRLNDAINTIIRRDETAETGDLLPPCVEAALNLGCVPERASRSQRHNNPRIYLTPGPQGPPPPPPPDPCRSSDNHYHNHNHNNKSANDRSPQFPPVGSPDKRSRFMRSEAVNSGLLVSDSNSDSLASPCHFQFQQPLSESCPHGSHPHGSHHNQLMNPGSVYPLYYGTNFKAQQESPSSFQILDQPQSDPVIAGTPVRTFTMEPADIRILHDPFASQTNAENISTSIAVAGSDFRRTEPKSIRKECDLSLRLGILSGSSTIMESNSAQERRDPRLDGSQEVPRMNREYTFLPLESSVYSSDCCSGKRSSEDGDRHLLATIRKRRAIFDNSQENVPYVSQPELPSNWYNDGRAEGPGT